MSVTQAEPCVGVAIADSNPVAGAEPVVLFEQADHRWVWLGADEEGGDEVAANQFVVQNSGRAALLDPGSVLDFARAVSNLSRFSRSSDVETIFYSHQDPDVSSAAPMWARVTPAKLWMSALWTRFVPHFGGVPAERIQAIPDEGEMIPLGNAQLEAIPAHFLHAPGNFALYDPVARILFTGDLGANLPPTGSPLYIDDFAAHLPHLDGFHRRYLASNAACRAFVRRVEGLPIDLIAPQHGSLYRGAAVGDLLDWLRELRCGIDLLD